MTKGRISPSHTASRRSNEGKTARRGSLALLTHSGTDQVDPARTDLPQRSPSGRKHGSGMNPLTPVEVVAVLKEARTHSPRNWAMILLAYRHGLRASEVCGLRLADIDLKAESASIRRLKGSLYTVQPLYQHKGQPLLDEGRALRCWLRERPADGSDYLFTSQKGGRLCRSQFFRLFQEYAASAGIAPEKCHPHVLKHSLATHLVGDNMNLAWVKQCLGHKAISSTMKYTFVTDAQATQAAQAALMRLY
jgi:type 1 fimbriae regulatory protein FimB